MKSPYRQLTPTEMRQVDAAVADIMGIVKKAKRSKGEAPCTSSASKPPKSPERAAA